MFEKDIDKLIERAKGNNPYENLAMAIVGYACESFCEAYQAFRYNPEDERAKEIYEEEKSFFYDKEFELLSKQDGPALVKRLEKLVREKNTERSAV